MGKTTGLHRHAEGEHVEAELRYYRPKGFTVPDSLAGMPRVETKSNAHVDRYFDAVADGQLVLRSQGCSLRVRRKASGDVFATFKRKQGRDSGAEALRIETEDLIACPSGADASEDRPGLFAGDDGYMGLVARGVSAALDRGRAAAGDAQLQYLFTVQNARTDHHYRDDTGHVVLSEDELSYPDGSTERRVEVEFVSGNQKTLKRIHKELVAAYPGLVVCKRGKLSEGRRRLARVLAG